MSSKKLHKADFFTRLNQVRKHYDLTQIEFSALIGISTGYFSDMKFGRSGPSAQIVYGVYVNCPDINIGWLLTGEGAMLESNRVRQTLQNYGNDADEFLALVRKIDKTYSVETKKALVLLIQGLLDLTA